MKERYIQILGIVIVCVYGLFVVVLYAAAPRSIADIPSAAKATIESAATAGSVITGTYEVDASRFSEGMNAFNSENYVLARERFERADPERRDARTQFYIAYSFYRQGWGRVSNDDELFRAGIAACDRVTALDRDFRTTDTGLKLQTAVELKNELEEGTRVTADDFNPLRLVRERK